MSYERQRASAIRMVNKYGTTGVWRRTVTEAGKNDWSVGKVQKISQAVSFVSFADDGVTFVNHNIQGDVLQLTVVSATPLDIQVSDTITNAQGREFIVKKAKALDPDQTGAILWSVLVQ